MEVGLCESCRHVQIVKSARGSLFYLCTLSKVDPSFPKYPELPVRVCTGYRLRDEEMEIMRDLKPGRGDPAYQQRKARRGRSG